MRKTILLPLILILYSCDEILDQEPRDRYSDNIVWEDLNLVDNYLKGCYRNLNILNGWNSIINLDAVSDDIYFIHIFGTNLYLEGNLTASSQGPFGDNYFNFINWGLYNNINSLNIFLEKIDMLAANPSNDPATLNTITRMKGEALFLRAYCYSKLATTYGGVPLVRTALKLGDDYTTIKRSSFEETIDFIASECDLAASLLPSKSETEMGRANNAAAMALKSRIRLFAASDLAADGTAQNEQVGYINPDRRSLWLLAKEAAEEVISLGSYNLADFRGSTTSETGYNYYSFFKQKDLADDEIIWGRLFRQDVGDTRQTNLHNGSNGNSNWGSNNPTQELVNAFRMEDGSDFFDHFRIDADGRYINISTKYASPNPYDNREARFYGSILYDGANWQARFSNLQDRDPVGIYDRRTRIYVQNGTEVQVIPGIDTRQGPVTPEDGGYTGYLMKKHLDDEVIGRDENNANAWIEFRYAEILLNYAEALIELGEVNEAAEHINQIRNRIGLPDYTGDHMEALRTERRIELVFENHRWYDLRRWKLLTGLRSAKGMTINETINLDSDESVTEWREISVQNRGIGDSRFYWIPIPFDEISRAPALEQNPGY